MTTEQTTTPDPAPAESGRCGQTFRGIVLNGERPTACCDLLAGHPGWHRDRAHGMEWGATDSADALASLRGELARVRPVVDAARAWCEGRAPSSAMYAAVAQLDGDAAATPQPAAPDMAAYFLRVGAEQVAARAASSAPPVDVPAGLRAAAKVLDEGDVYLGVTREANALRRLADTIEADPSDATSQAIVRALATPSTDTPGGDR